MSRPAGQLTLGEVQAIARAEARLDLAPAKHVDRDRFIERLQAARLCAVCGWSRDVHSGPRRSLTCQRYTHP